MAAERPPSCAYSPARWNPIREPCTMPGVYASGISGRSRWLSTAGPFSDLNGSGKTTLLRILTGQMESDKGTVHYARGIRFGYLRQEQMVEHGWTVFRSQWQRKDHPPAHTHRPDGIR